MNYNTLRRHCALSQSEASDMHSVSLDTVKSWCCGRRKAPQFAIEQLTALLKRRVGKIVQPQGMHP